MDISKKVDIPLIASQEIFYIYKEMYEAHDALKCIGEKNYIDDKNRFKLSDQHYLKENDELANLYSDIPEALENNYNFHLRFNFKPKQIKPILPSIANKKSNSPEDELIRSSQKRFGK